MDQTYSVHIRGEKGTLPYSRDSTAARYLVGDFRYADSAYLTLHDVRKVNGSPHLPPETFGINHDNVDTWVAERVQPDGSPLGAGD